MIWCTFLAGFDASAHMWVTAWFRYLVFADIGYFRTEETHNAATAGSYGIITAIGVSAILGWFLILGLLFSIQDYQGTIGSSTGQPVAQIFIDTVGTDGAIALMVCRESPQGAVLDPLTLRMIGHHYCLHVFVRDVLGYI